MGVLCRVVLYDSIQGIVFTVDIASTTEEDLLAVALRDRFDLSFVHPLHIFQSEVLVRLTW